MLELLHEPRHAVNEAFEYSDKHCLSLGQWPLLKVILNAVRPFGEATPLYLAAHLWESFACPPMHQGHKIN